MHSRPLAVFSLVAVLGVVTACSTDSGGPEGRGEPLGRAGGGRGFGPRSQRPGETWKQYDLNGDGKITRPEFMAVRGLCFARYDANGDGILTWAEVQRLFPTHLAERLGAVFSRMDVDGDGEISREEYDLHSDRLLRFLDTNGDGVIAGMELSSLESMLLGDICQPSGPPESGGGMGLPGPAGGTGPRRPR